MKRETVQLETALAMMELIGRKAELEVASNRLNTWQRLANKASSDQTDADLQDAQGDVDLLEDAVTLAKLAPGASSAEAIYYGNYKSALGWGAVDMLPGVAFGRAARAARVVTAETKLAIADAKLIRGALTEGDSAAAGAFEREAFRAPVSREQWMKRFSEFGDTSLLTKEADGAAVGGRSAFVERAAAIRSALTDASGTLLSPKEREGVLYTIRRVEARGYRLKGAIKTNGNQGIDLWFEGTGSNSGRIGFAEAKASKGLGSLKTDVLGIRQGSLEFFDTRLGRAGEFDLRAELRAGNADLFGGFSGSNRLFQFDPVLFGRWVNFRITPGAARLIP